MTQHIAATIDSLLQQIKKQQGPVLWLQRNWGAIVGDALAQHSIPKQLSSKTLLVEVSGPGEGYLFRMEQQSILEKIQKHTGLTVERIQTRQGS
jgi:hypothetical protein